MHRLLLCVITALGVTSGAVFAQSATVPDPNAFSTGTVVLNSDFLVVDRDRLFDDSRFGKRVRAEITAESTALAEENRRIEAELIVEERALTDQRASLSPEAFRDLADAFDAKVTQIRITQDRKARTLADQEEVERRRFLTAIAPILTDLLRELGAVAIFDQRSVFLSDDRIDITDRAISQIDAALGEGTGALLEGSVSGIADQ